MLLKTLRTLVSPAKEQASPRVETAPEPEATYAWQLLGGGLGVQQQHYLDLERPWLAGMFGHTPRRMLDIGCAKGAVAAGFRKSIPGLWAWGCELNPEAAAVAATRLDHVTAVPREEWDPADVELVKTVDTVLLLDVLEHMYNPWGELQFLAAHLPAGSQVIVSLPNIGHLSVLKSIAEGAFPYAGAGILDITHVRFFTFREMEAMFEQTGFRIEAHQPLSDTERMDIPQFPAAINVGKLTLTVDSAEEWQRLNTVQFVFRLTPGP